MPLSLALEQLSFTAASGKPRPDLTRLPCWCTPFYIVKGLCSHTHTRGHTVRDFNAKISQLWPLQVTPAAPLSWQHLWPQVSLHVGAHLWAPLGSQLWPSLEPSGEGLHLEGFVQDSGLNTGVWSRTCGKQHPCATLVTWSRSPSPPHPISEVPLPPGTSQPLALGPLILEH